eukprot:Em0015g443a
MLKELSLLVTLLALFADARPQPYKLKDTVEMSDKVEDGGLVVSRDDILDDMIISYVRAKNAEGLKTQETTKMASHGMVNRELFSTNAMLRNIDGSHDLQWEGQIAKRTNLFHKPNQSSVATTEGTSRHATKAQRNSEGMSAVHKRLPKEASAEQRSCEAEVYDEQRRLHAYASKPERPAEPSVCKAA